MTTQTCPYTILKKIILFCPDVKFMGSFQLGDAVTTLSRTNLRRYIFFYKGVRYEARKVTSR